jgi:S1-C subfamily serine protease
MKTTIIKQLAVGFIGGLLPLATYLTINYYSDDSKLSDRVLDGNKQYNARFASMQGTPVDFIQASENTINSVVHVTTKVVQTSFQRDIFQEFFYGPGAGGRELKQYGSGSGSGVIVSSEGYIVTNNHVIENASEIEVILNDNSKYSAKVIGTDPSTDIAILKIEGSGFQPIPLGNSDDLKVGEWVLAVGNPYNLNSTVTAGIVSAKARNLDTKGIQSFIQTDAAVNPGNSGGGIFDSKTGNLMGIVTSRLNDDQIGFKTEGISFATQLTGIVAFLKNKNAFFHIKEKNTNQDLDLNWVVYDSQSYKIGLNDVPILIRDTKYKPTISISDNQQATVQIIAE